MGKRKTKNKIPTPLEKCKSVIGRFLLRSPDIPICSENIRLTIDSVIVDYLVRTGNQEFLFNDVSFGPQIGGLSDKALYDFSQEGRVFNSNSGRFQIRHKYGEYSERFYEAWSARPKNEKGR